MVAMSNGVLSDECMIISGIENRNCHSNGASTLSPKWKPRNMSAVRDFPPRCGPVVQPVNMVAQEDAASLLLLDDNGVDSLVKELQDGDSRAAGKEVASCFINGVVQVGGVKPLSPPQGVSSGINDNKKNKFPQVRLYAVRDFPPYCGLNAAEPTEEERIRINGKRSSKGKDKNGGKSVRLKETVVVGGESIRNVQNRIETDVIGVRPRNKLHTVTRTGSNVVAVEDSKGFQGKNVKNGESEKMVAALNNRSLFIFPNDSKNIRASGDADDLGCIKEEMRIELGQTAPSFCPSRSVNFDLTDPLDRTSKSDVTTHRSKKRAAAYGENLCSVRKGSYTGKLDLVAMDEEEFTARNEDQREDPHDVNVTLPPFGPKSSSDARNKVRETLRLFQALSRKLLQGEEAKTNEGDESLGQTVKNLRRIDLAVMRILKEKGKEHNAGSMILGSVPGVEIGDEFQYRVELNLVGIHRPYQAGIDFYKQGKVLVAASIVASGGYDDELDNPDCLIYSGSGGMGGDKKPESQKLERGNLALKNNISLMYPVRVIRGYRVTKAADAYSRPREMITYIYDGLYMVENYWQETGPLGNLVFKYELKRIPGQPELAVRELKKSKKFKKREGLCVDDITSGKELLPIPAFNTIDNEKAPPFNYIAKMIYPDLYQNRPVPRKGCDCALRCSGKKCLCAFKNGGVIPYNHNGAIVETKALVYECGPSCKCPPSCYNRVTQHGIKIQLEIFKTKSRGWGVRSLNSISSGSFICEYIGELLEDTEAEKRTGNDQYLFDIGKNYNDCSANTKVLENGGFTIDAATYGNVGRFINHSCTPNLYAQNVLYDQEDKRMPHIMLFAAENIPPLKELTYHYNYQVNTVHDSDGNVKIKKCYCGSAGCRGRLY